MLKIVEENRVEARGSMEIIPSTWAIYRQEFPLVQGLRTYEDAVEVLLRLVPNL